MSIIGIGTDLVEIARVRRVLARHGERFAARVLVRAELERWRHHGDPGSFLARRWAVKEAAAKAMGTGIGGALGFHDLHIGATVGGAPTLQVTGQGATTAEGLGIGSWHVSITDEGAYALAFVVAEAAPGPR